MSIFINYFLFKFKKAKKVNFKYRHLLIFYFSPRKYQEVFMFVFRKLFSSSLYNDCLILHVSQTTIPFIETSIPISIPMPFFVDLCIDIFNRNESKSYRKITKFLFQYKAFHIILLKYLWCFPLELLHINVNIFRVKILLRF